MKFAKKLEAVKAEIGGSVSLSCELSHAKGKVTWSRNGVEIKPSKRFQLREEGTKRTLTITGIRAEDEGEYSCQSRDDKSSVTIVPKRTSLMVAVWRDPSAVCGSQSVKGTLTGARKHLFEEIMGLNCIHCAK